MCACELVGAWSGAWFLGCRVIRRTLAACVLEKLYGLLDFCAVCIRLRHLTRIWMLFDSAVARGEAMRAYGMSEDLVVR